VSERHGSVERAVAVLGPAAPFPMVDGDPVFAEPWEGRAFAMAVDVVERSGVAWEAFRMRLVAAIAQDPQRPYYESWVVALEGLVLDVGAVQPSDLERQRQLAASYRYREAGHGDVEVFPLRRDEVPGVLAALGADLDPEACAHVERYRTVGATGAGGPWRCRAFDAADTLLLDIAWPPVSDDTFAR
jgi:nitrile hydratase accessory protein